MRLIRDGTVVYDGVIASLRRFNEDARDVASGFDCGIVDFQTGIRNSIRNPQSAIHDVVIRPAPG